jgi:predicted ester cyclase
MGNYIEIIRHLYTRIIIKQQEAGNRSDGNYLNQYAVSAKLTGLKNFYKFFAAVNQAFKNCDLSLDSMLVKGDRVMTHYTIQGTQKEYFMGIPPSNQKMTITGIDVFRIENDRIVQHWDVAHQMNAFPVIDRIPLATFGNRNPQDTLVTSQSNGE